MKEIKVQDFNENVFNMIGNDWLLITAEKDGKVNTMTASWGGAGVLWNKKVAYIFIRPQRYTKEFVGGSAKLSLSVLPEKYRKELTYLGRVSGRDEDKIQKAGLTIEHYEGVPGFKESRITFVCRKLYGQYLEEGCFIDKDLMENCYPQKDYHMMYVVEIEKIISM